MMVRQVQFRFASLTRCFAAIVLGAMLLLAALGASDALSAEAGGPGDLASIDAAGDAAVRSVSRGSVARLDASARASAISERRAKNVRAVPARDRQPLSGPRLANAGAKVGPSAPGRFEPALAVVGVNILPMDRDVVLRDQTIVVERGIIAAVGPMGQVRVPRGARIVDGRGKYLMPGLADMHVHVGDARELPLFLATGITTIRIMSGAPEHLAWRSGVNDGSLLGPRIIASSPIIDGNPPVWPPPTSRTVETSGQAETAVAEFAAQGYDFIKIYHKVDAASYTAAMSFARRHGFRMTGHVPFSVGIDRALAARQYSIEHFRGYDFDGAPPSALTQNGGRTPERFASWLAMSDTRMRELVRLTAEAGTWNCPTLVLNQLLTNPRTRRRVVADPRMRLVPPEIRNRVSTGMSDDFFTPATRSMIELGIPKQYRLLRALSDAGAGLIVGTDSSLPYVVPGYTALDEIAMFVEAGLTPFQALQAATSSPARFAGNQDVAGTVEVGKRADLLLLDANPLEDVANLWRQAGVMIRGRYLTHAELERMLAAQAEPETPAGRRQ